MSQRKTRAPETAPTPMSRTTDVISAVIAAVFFVVFLAIVMVPVTWALVRGYRWALA